MAKFMEIRWQERSVIGGGRARRRAFEDLSIKCRTGRSDCLVVDPQSGKIILNRKYSSDFVKVPERQRLWEVTQERADAFRDVYRGDTWQGEMFLTEIKRAAKKVNPTEPVSVILATGPKGTGKTFLGEAAAVAFGKGVPVKIECQQSVESHMVAPFLFGSPPGYKNSEMGGALTRPLLARKDQIIIFDEFTRAHSSLIETIMNVLGAGTAVDMGTRRVVDLKQCLFILTTNEKGDELAEMVEKMEASGSLPDEIEEAARELLAPTLKPEHWDRIRLVLPITKTPSNRVIVDAVIKEYDLGGKVTEDQIERALEKGKSLKKNVGWRQRKKFFEGELVD